MNIDYELVEKIGATHYLYGDNDEVVYLKVVGGSFDKYVPSRDWWDSTGITPCGVLHYGVKPIPPRPKVEVAYEKVTDSIFDLKDEFERGELYFMRGNGDYDCVGDNHSDVVKCMYGDNLCRRVEKPVDWVQCVTDSIPDGFGVTKAMAVGNIDIEGVYDKQQAIKLANAILRATGEL